jgi:hypothetical protein
VNKIIQFPLAIFKSRLKWENPTFMRKRGGIPERNLLWPGCLCVSSTIKSLIGSKVLPNHFIFSCFNSFSINLVCFLVILFVSIDFYLIFWLITTILLIYHNKTKWTVQHSLPTFSQCFRKIQTVTTPVFALILLKLKITLKVLSKGKMCSKKLSQLTIRMDFIIQMHLS